MKALTASHEQASRRLPAYAGGELGPIARWRVSRHLDGCERCRRLLRALRLTGDALRSLGRHEPPGDPGLADAVLRRIRGDS